MKKAILLFLSLGLFSLVACNAVQPGNQAEQTVATEQTTKQPQIDARPPRPQGKEEQLQWLICELQHRQFVAEMKLEEQDLSDIIEENDDMELSKVYTKIRIATEQHYSQYYKDEGIAWLEKTIPGSVEILEEDDKKIVANAYAQSVYRNVGSDGMTSMGRTYKATFKKEGDNYVIADYEAESKEYILLKNKQQKYMKQGMSKSEANQKIYEDHLEELSKQTTTITTT